MALLTTGINQSEDPISQHVPDRFGMLNHFSISLNDRRAGIVT
jgi:hypothetical protein